MPTDKLSYAQRFMRKLWLKVRPFVVKPVADLKDLECSVEQLEKTWREKRDAQAKVATEVNGLQKGVDELVDAIVDLLMFVLNTGKDEKKS